MKKVTVGKSKGLADAEQCDIHGVSVNEERVAVCDWCKGEGWIDYDMTTEPCSACGGKQTER